MEVFTDTLPSVLAQMSEHMLNHYLPGGPSDYYLLTGRAGLADWSRAVVCRGASIVHDPAPEAEPGAVSIAPPPGGMFIALVIFDQPSAAHFAASSAALLRSLGAK